MGRRVGGLVEKQRSRSEESIFVAGEEAAATAAVAETPNTASGRETATQIEQQR
jgi:hypothetical protein